MLDCLLYDEASELYLELKGNGLSISGPKVCLALSYYKYAICFCASNLKMSSVLLRTYSTSNLANLSPSCTANWVSTLCAVWRKAQHILALRNLPSCTLFSAQHRGSVLFSCFRAVWTHSVPRPMPTRMPMAIYSIVTSPIINSLGSWSLSIAHKGCSEEFYSWSTLGLAFFGLTSLHCTSALDFGELALFRYNLYLLCPWK